MNRDLYERIVIKKEHRKYRKALPDMAESFAKEGLSPRERMARRFEAAAAAETPVVLPGETISLLRTVTGLPDVLTQAEWAEIRKSNFVHELGYYSNLTVDYAYILQKGLLACREEGDEFAKREIDALLDLCDRYRAAEEAAGNAAAAELLRWVPRCAPESYPEALQMVRIVSYALWLEGNYHNTLGRFDRYMFPYLRRDMEAGKLSRAEALELTEEFFLSLNRDSDLYPGIQQGDDGQSLMLGGRDRDGKGGFNLLSELCIEASGNLCLIDPKINVRVDKDTPREIFTLCSGLTAKGLGFPQYSNDDIVLPGLEKLGYAPEDAADYTVAACWEFIIPHVGMDIPNVAALSFPKAVDTCLHRDLPGAPSYEAFEEAVKREVAENAAALCKSVGKPWFVPSPLLECFMHLPEDGPKYRNFGMHGVGLSTAADSLVSVKEHIFEKKDVTKERLIAGVDSDFADDPELLHLLRYETPKLGAGSGEAERCLTVLLDTFAEELSCHRNPYGGVWRPGTGSAMFYLRFAEDIPASPDGRRKGEPLAANYSVSLFAKPDGPFSLIRAMTAPDLTKTVNGGPLTVEFHSSVFAAPEALEAVGDFVRSFIQLGGHQLQLNSVNADTLKDAQLHPENYPQLIVRIWGWSAYFTELDKPYQDHVIRRQEYSL